MSLRAILWVFDHSESTLGARLVLLALAEYAHDDGTKAFPDVETIAAKTRMDRRNVQRNLRTLEDSGEIVCTGTTKSGTRIYSLPEMQGGGKTSPQGRHNATPRGGAAPPDPKTLEPTTEPSSLSRSTALARIGPEPPAVNALVAEFVDETRLRGIDPPKRVNARMGKAVKKLVEEGRTADEIRAGFKRMLDRRSMRPELLPEFVVEAALPDTAAPTRFGRGLTTAEMLKRTEGLK